MRKYDGGMKSEHTDIVVVIPALSSWSVFQDDLLQKLAGVSLIQRAFDKAMEITGTNKSIVLVTDNPKVRLIGHRYGIERLLLLSSQSTEYPELENLLAGLDLSIDNRIVLILSPYAPLLRVDTVNLALSRLVENGTVDIVVPVMRQSVRTANNVSPHKGGKYLRTKIDHTHVKSFGFTLLKGHLLTNCSESKDPNVVSLSVGDDVAEIESQKDWWICEKLLLRQRVVFRIVGNSTVGLGHIYRALSLAREIKDHEVVFVCDTNNQVAINQLVGYDYPLRVFRPDLIIEGILELQPDLLINDILDTRAKDVTSFQERGVRVINFEDLGQGAQMADVTINELYEKPQISASNILWGKKYYFVRDEFSGAKRKRFKKQVDSVLITFGGTDQHDLTKRVYRLLEPLCTAKRIHIYIVTGPGYLGYSQLREEIGSRENVSLTHATGVISEIMEKVQIAVTSNGRTVYELAHMSIPALIIYQHDREQTHDFSCEQNGFVPMGLYNDPDIDNLIQSNFKELIDNEGRRQHLFNCIKGFQFHKNKDRVLKVVNQQLLNGRFR